MDDLISRQAAIDAPKIFTKDCNPEHFVGHSNFIEYMDTVGIRSFGNWQYANGFNMGLTAAEVAIEKLPSAEPERKNGKWLTIMDDPRITFDECKCSVCGVIEYFNKGWKKFSYCPNCGARMVKGESDESRNCNKNPERGNSWHNRTTANGS